MYILQNFYRWLRTGKCFWYFIIPLLLTIVLFFLLRPHECWGLSIFKISGIIWEIFGLLTVLTSLSKEIKKYGYAEYRKYFISWLFKFPKIFKRPSINVHTSMTLAPATSTFIAITTHTRQAPTTTEEKIKHIIDELERIEKIIEATNTTTNHNISLIHNKIEDLDTNIKADFSSIKDELREKATGEYYLLVSGLLLTGLGMLITNTPDQIYKHLGFAT